jgi:hypothetical protein
MNSYSTKSLIDVFEHMLLLINQLDIVLILSKIVCEIFFLLIVRMIKCFFFIFLWLIDCADYLLCTNIKKRYYNLDNFEQWITNELLSHCNVYSTSRNVIIMNNVNVHYNSRIRKIIETYKCRVKYLFLYSSNYNLIELSFSMLKTWLRRNFHESWSHFEEIFEDFLKYAINKSQCDRFVKEHFKHSVEIEENYIFQNDIQVLNEQLHKDQINVE